MEIIFDQKQKAQDNFTLEFQDSLLNVRRIVIKNQVIFHVTFDNGKLPLVLTRATRHDLSRFWTSVPEGRQKEAEAIGPLIGDYFQSNQ
jgi:hypothetical protein